jgi:G3E family GTPase
MGAYADLIPIHVLTGFLGSGKTTILRRLLQSPKLQDTAVLVNEFGEVGLDHHLIEHASESTLLLDNGCLCCAVRGDLQESLRDLLDRRERGEIPRFERVVIETSGLADPVPIAYTVLADPLVQHHYRLGTILTVVDAVNTAAGLTRFPARRARSINGATRPSRRMPTAPL